MGAVPIAPNIATPISDAGRGSNHQHVAASAGVQEPPSHLAPVPVAVNLAGGVVGTPYTETISAQRGQSPYTFAVTSGSLPAGLSMSNAGMISGAPTTITTSTFTVEVTDANGSVGTQDFSITVVAATSAGSPNYCMVS